MVLCSDCRAALLQDGEGKALTVQVGPILRDALATLGPGEDVDEALLRALKARYSEEAANLLSAILRIVEIEARQAGESKEVAVRRLAASQPGPEIALRTTGGRVVGGEFPTTVSETVSQTHLIRVGDKEYHSLEEAPPHLRRIVQGARASGRPGRKVLRAGPEREGLKTGCSWVLAGPLLAALLRLFAK